MKSFKEKIIVFLKDFSIYSVSEDKLPDSNLISFILVPLIGTNGYLYIKNKHLLRMDTASLSFRFLIEFYGDGIPQKIINLDGRTVVTGSIIEFCNLMYSLSKYALVTSFENCYVRDDIPYEISVEPDYLDLQIYSKDGEVILSSSITPDMRTPAKFSILDKLISKFFKYDDQYLIIRDNSWSKVSKNKIKDSDLVGIPSSITKTIVFLESREFKTVSDAVKGISMDICIIDANEYHGILESRHNVTNSLTQGELNLSFNGYDSDVIPLKMLSTWEHDINDILNIINIIKSLSFILNTFVDLFYASYLESRHSNMNIVPIVVLQNELISIKLRNYSEYYVGDEIINLQDYISLIYDLYREL